MPAGDGTGPRGMGPMTGRAAGYCAGYGAPGYANAAPGRGMGMGWGRGGGGRGWRNWYYATGVPGWARFGAAPAWGATPSPDQEAAFLKTQADSLRQQLDAISQRIADLERKE